MTERLTKHTLVPPFLAHPCALREVCSLELPPADAALVAPLPSGESLGVSSTLGAETLLLPKAILQAAPTRSASHPEFLFKANNSSKKRTFLEADLVPIFLV